MGKLNPDALAACGDSDLDAREGVQEVDSGMIRAHVEFRELPTESADPFAEWLNVAWNEYNEDGKYTNGDVIAGALDYWRGGRLAE